MLYRAAHNPYMVRIIRWTVRIPFCNKPILFKELQGRTQGGPGGALAPPPPPPKLTPAGLNESCKDWTFNKIGLLASLADLGTPPPLGTPPSENPAYAPELRGKSWNPKLIMYRTYLCHSRLPCVLVYSSRGVFRQPGHPHRFCSHWLRCC